MPFDISGVFSRLYSWVNDRDTGVKINAPRMDAEFNGVKDAINAIVGQTQPFINPVKAPNGTAAAPSYTFDGDQDNGFYRIGPNQMGISTGGINRITVDSTGATFNVPVIAAAGSVTAPSITTTGDTNTGGYFPAADQFAITTGGTQRALFSTTAITTTLPIRAAVGSAAAPAYSFSPYTNTGIFGTAVGVVVSALGNTVANFNTTSCYLIQPLAGEGAVYSSLLARSVGGTANAITLTGFGTASFVAGAQVRFIATSTNTGATTINLDGSGAKNCITVTGAALPAGYIRTDVATVATYTGTDWVIDRVPEYGSNANGEYWRYADGRQECINSVSSSQAINIAFFGGFRSAEQTWPFPATFAAVPSFAPTADNSTAFGATSTTTTTTSAGRFAWTSVTTQTAATRNAMLIAIGRWF